MKRIPLSLLVGGLIFGTFAIVFAAQQQGAWCLFAFACCATWLCLFAWEMER